MAGFHTKTFLKHDDYMTPKSAWENIEQYIPKDKVLWECFYGDGKSGTYLEELGFEVIHEEIDFYKHNKGDILISNPPFSDCKNIMTRLAELDKPFIMLMPSAKINTSYIRNNFKGKELQIIIPRKRIQFVKLVDGEEITTNKCNFDCFYYCYKMNLPQSIVWLEIDSQTTMEMTKDQMTKDQIIEKLMKENAELKEERDKFKRQYEKRRTKHLSREDELAKIVCPHSNTQSYKDIKEGCLKLAFENEKLKYKINKLK
jgi:hypothetical protein